MNKHYGAGLCRGLLASTEACLLETKAWMDVARSATGNEKVVAHAVVDAFKDFTERMEKAASAAVKSVETAIEAERAQ